MKNGIMPQNALKNDKITKTIKRIMDATENKSGPKRDYYSFIRLAAGFILKIIALEKKLDDNYFKKTGFETLLIENHSLYNEIYPQNYSKSYADPAFCVKIFGAENGRLISYFYYALRNLIEYAYLHRKNRVDEYAAIFIRFCEYIESAKKINCKDIEKIVTAIDLDDMSGKRLEYIRERYDPGFSFYKDIVNSASDKDLRYLFRYGCHIGINEIKTADFINRLSAAEIRHLAKHIAAAYIEGFITENKNRGGRDRVKIIPSAGYERMIRELMREFERLGFKCIINIMESTDANSQCDYDHRYDRKPVLSAKFVADATDAYEKALKKIMPEISKYSGQARVGTFGEEPFSPAEKKECYALDKPGQKFHNQYMNDILNLFSKYIPDANTSFTAIRFPNPEIGPDFEEIFMEILKINTLDTKKYIRIQQRIIDALDIADRVHIKGAGTNRTDITVKMPGLKDPEKETNFYNCGADVNIPVGEVFTTPELKGTNGTLHIEETYLDGFNYKDLVLEFKDGCVTGYSCRNFADAKQNQKYIEENLFSLKEGLPIGEFAIGTNTLAYAVAKKYGIEKKLPILIAEKMGPHFAIGDTCYCHVEEIPIYNQINKKEVTARENERTALRNEVGNKAYTNVHVDITLPYESIEFIRAVKKTAAGKIKDKRNIIKSRNRANIDDGNIETDIIVRGRFVLAGTEELNTPLEGIK